MQHMHFLVVIPGDDIASEYEFSPIRKINAVKDLEQRGFSGTVVSDQGDMFSLFNFK